MGDVSNLQGELLSPSTSLTSKFRALFTLRSIGSRDAIDAISAAFDSKPGALLGHELAYVLGQMGDAYALPTLEKVLGDSNEHPMVRHEASPPVFCALVRSQNG